MTILAYLGEIGAALAAIAWQLFALVKVLGVLAVILGVLDLLFDPKGKERVGHLISNIVGGALSVAIPLLGGLEKDLQSVVKAFVAGFQGFGPQIRSEIEGPVTAFVQGEFNTAEANLLTLGESTPDNAINAGAVAMAAAFGFGIASHGVTAAFESVFPEKLNTFQGAGPMLSEMAGFKEIAAALRDPLYHNAFGKAAEYHYRSIFRPELPDEFDAVLWHSRRLLTDDQLRRVFHYSGLKTEYETPYIRSAYRAVQPRAIASMIQDVVFPYDQMKDLLEFAGLRDVDVHLLLDLLEQNSTKNLRGKYVDALLHAAERGTMTLADLDSHMNSLNFSALAQNYVHLTVSIRKLDQLLEIYRKQVTILYETGQLADADYVPTLEAAGIAAADAEAHYGVDSSKLRGKVLLQQERAAAGEARRLQAVAAKDAEEQFMTGHIDALALGIALAAAGVPPLMVPHLVEIFVARKGGNQVYVFGKPIDRKDEALLREQVAAVEEQTLKKLITPPQALQALATLGIPQPNAEALVSRWAAQADKVILPV